MDILEEIAELKIDWNKQPKEEIDPKGTLDSKRSVQISSDMQDLTAVFMRAYKYFDGQSQKQLKIRRLFEQFADLCYKVLDPRVTNALTFKYYKQQRVSKLNNEI